MSEATLFSEWSLCASAAGQVRASTYSGKVEAEAAMENLRAKVRNS